MSRLAKYQKDPDERKRYLVDYDQWLDTGESIQSTDFSVVTNTVASPLVVDGVQIGPDNRSVQYYVSAGLNGTDYEIRATIITDIGQTKEDVILFQVRAN